MKKPVPHNHRVSSFTFNNDGEGHDTNEDDEDGDESSGLYRLQTVKGKQSSPRSPLSSPTAKPKKTKSADSGDGNGSSISSAQNSARAREAVPKLNLSGLATSSSSATTTPPLAPPPIDPSSTISTYSLSARGAGPFPPHSSAASAMRRGSGSNDHSMNALLQTLPPPPPLTHSPIASAGNVGFFSLSNISSGGGLATTVSTVVPAPVSVAVATPWSPSPDYYTMNNTANSIVSHSRNHGHMTSSQHTQQSGGLRSRPDSASDLSVVSFTDYNSNNNRNQSLRKHRAQLLNSHQKLRNYNNSSNKITTTPGTVGSLTTTAYYTPSQYGTNTSDAQSNDFERYHTCRRDIAEQLQWEQEDAEELQRSVMLAATETAMALQASRDDFESRRLVIRNCQKLNEANLIKLLTFDPALAMSRATDLGALAIDGQTPLHVAASFGNIDALKILFEMGGDEVSAWVRDMQGRTPLHIAAEKGKIECCTFLRERMKEERSHADPVGLYAPVDLAGQYPMESLCLSTFFATLYMILNVIAESSTAYNIYMCIVWVFVTNNDAFHSFLV